MLLLAGLFLPAGEAQAQKAFELVVTGARVNIRAKPMAQGRVVGKAVRGDRFPALGPSRDKKWIKVKYKGREAWVSANPNLINVREVKGSAPQPTPPPGDDPKWATVVNDSEVRLGPDGIAPVVTEVTRGDYVRFAGFSKDKKFVKVLTPEGAEGWIAKADVVPGKRDDIGNAVKKKKDKKKKKKDPKVVRRRPPRGSTRGAEITPVFAYVRQAVATDPSGSIFRYDLDAFAPGGQLWIDWPLRENFMNGTLDYKLGYLFIMPGGAPAPNTDPPVILGTQVHRVDLAAEYKRALPWAGMELVGVGGYRFHLYYIQPQTLSYFLSNHYHLLNLQAGVRYPLMQDRLWIEGRGGVLPGLLIETHGAGQTGSSGNIPLCLGYEAVVDTTYNDLPGGFEAGLHVGFSLYNTQFQGEGFRAGSRLFNANVQDMIVSAGLIIQRGF